MEKLLSMAGLLFFVSGGCGGGAVQLQETPQPEAPSKLDAVSPPSKPISIPEGNTNWTPATIRSGRGDALSQALRERSSLALILPNVWRGAEMEDRIFQMVKLVSPDTRIVARGSAALDGLSDRHAEIPKERQGTDGQEGSIFIPEGHPLYREWMVNEEISNGAEALLVVRPIRLDREKLPQTSKKRDGGCDGVMAELKEGIAAATGGFSHYEQEASKRLYEAFRRHLEVALPFWRDELERRKSAGSADAREARCVDSYLEWLGQYAPCVKGSCDGSPRLSATEGGTVGMTDGKDYPRDDCPTAGMRDYTAELAQLATRSVLEVLPSLDNGWIGELIRYDGLTRLTAVIEEGCAPRHRRIVMEELAGVREAVRRYLTHLREGTFRGTWEAGSGRARIPGVGPVKILARVRVTAGDPAVEVSDIEKRMRRMERCNQGKDRPIQVILVDLQSSAVVFMGIFDEADLLCHGLPPG